MASDLTAEEVEDIFNEAEEDGIAEDDELEGLIDELNESAPLSKSDDEILKTVSGVPGGSFTACVAHFKAKGGVDDPEALCAKLEHKATGHWPGERVGKQGED